LDTFIVFYDNDSILAMILNGLIKKN